MEGFLKPNLDKSDFLSKSPSLSFRFFLRLLFFKEFSQAFLITKIVIFSFYSFPNGSSLWDVGLAIGILNKLFRPRLLA